MQRNVYAYAKSAKPIGHEEFAAALKSCQPQAGWGESIAVSNSGGPDSTCLLFLIKRHIDTIRLGGSHEQLQRVVSLSIDHQLQPASTAMAEQTAKIAERLGVVHINKSIGWNTKEFPELPTSGAEGVSRLARYHLLHTGMLESKSDVIAFGHHCDDQVETALMRLAKGSRAYGAAGMKPLRRWGMGVAEKYSNLGWTGHRGMNKWIIRPLLSFPKDRLLATCDENGLEYVVDKTNFMPSYTFRNCIRDFLQSGEPDVVTYARKANISLDFKVDLQRSRDMLFDSSKLAGDADVSDIRSAVTALGLRAREIDSQVDKLLAECKSPASPIGTYILDMDSQFSELSQELRVLLITRVLRFVSPHPWGSLRSTNKHRMDGLLKILNNLENPFYQVPPFVGGSGVKWTAVLISGDRITVPSHDTIHRLKSGAQVIREQRVGWLASRQPPVSNLSENEDPTVVDLTKAIRDYLLTQPQNPILEVLYDCRFVVQIDLSQIPQELGDILGDMESNDRIMIRPVTRYQVPQVILESEDESRILHSSMSSDPRTLLPDEYQPPITMLPPPVMSKWISIRWVRHLTG